MSSSKQMAPAKLSGRERAQLFLIATTTLPLREGGGIVFPRGFPGKGFRLDEWQFDRYRAAMERTLLGEDSKRRTKLVLSVYLLYGASMLFVVLFGAQLRSSAMFADYYGQWLPLAIVLLASAALILVPRFVRKKAYGFTGPIVAGAPSVGRFAFRRERILRIFACGTVNVRTLLIVSSLFVFVATSFLLFAVFGATRPTVFILLSLLCLLLISRRIYWLYVYWRFRLARGRGPAADEFDIFTLAS